MDLSLSSLTRMFKLVLIGLRLATISQRSQLYYSTEYCTRLKVTQFLNISPSTFPLLSPSWTISYFFFITLTDSELYTVDAVQCLQKTRALIIVLQVEYIQLEQVKYDHRQKHYAVIDDM